MKCEREWCDNTFTETRGGKKFCSDRCWRGTKPIPQTRTCANQWCTAPVSGHAMKKYCSRKCSRNIIPKELRMTENVCQFEDCGKTFLPKNVQTQKYCSQNCTQAEYRRKTGVMTRKELKEYRQEARDRWNRPSLNPSSLSKITKACELHRTPEEKKEGITLNLKLEIMEALVARGHILTEEEYVEEITELVKPSGKTLEYLLDYAESMHYKKGEFHYSHHTYDDHVEFKSDFDGYEEPVYGISLFHGGISMTA